LPPALFLKKKKYRERTQNAAIAILKSPAASNCGLPAAGYIVIITVMRRFFFVIILLLGLLQTPHSSNPTAAEENPGRANFSAPQKTEKIDRSTDSEDDIFSTAYERELLLRKLFQKTLPPLSNKEKIIWSFKTAKANTFL
jgi:hypothetical protein